MLSNLFKGLLTSQTLSIIVKQWILFYSWDSLFGVTLTICDFVFKCWVEKLAVGTEHSDS